MASAPGANPGSPRGVPPLTPDESPILASFSPVTPVFYPRLPQAGGTTCGIIGAASFSLGTRPQVNRRRASSPTHIARKRRPAQERRVCTDSELALRKTFGERTAVAARSHPRERQDRNGDAGSSRDQQNLDSIASSTDPDAIRLLSRVNSIASVTSESHPAVFPPQERINTGPVQPAATIDENIRRLLKTPIEVSADKLEDETGYGYVYLLEDKGWSGVYKIGTTDEGINQRRKKIEQRCQRSLASIYLGQQRFRYARRAERLIQAELMNYQRPYRCRSCNKKSSGCIHREYFEIDQGEAEKVIKRWTDFISARPYTSNGELDRYWKYRLMKDCTSYTGCASTDRRIQERHWYSTVNPSGAHWLYYVSKRWLQRPKNDKHILFLIAEQFWVISTVALAIWVIVLMYHIDTLMIIVMHLGAAAVFGRFILR